MKTLILSLLLCFGALAAEAPKTPTCPNRPLAQKVMLASLPYNAASPVAPFARPAASIIPGGGNCNVCRFCTDPWEAALCGLGWSYGCYWPCDGTVGEKAAVKPEPAK